jgi:UDP-N-acetylmuramoylalanine--D-glutamate ligase
VPLIGQMADKIAWALQQAGYTDVIPGGQNMNEIIENARKEAKKGDIVLLSTACASFGMFNNYKDRGNQFKAAVHAL